MVEIRGLLDLLTVRRTSAVRSSGAGSPRHSTTTLAAVELSGSLVLSLHLLASGKGSPIIGGSE
jgi:hypothetical protein